MDDIELKKVAANIDMKYSQTHDAMRKRIANYFFEKTPKYPIATLKKVFSEKSSNGCSESKRRKIDKSDPIVTLLRIMKNFEIKDVVRKLGQNRLRNYESMRTFVAQYFYDIDQISPLKSLQKFLIWELPEHDVTQKQETTKRKHEGGSGSSAKKSKTSLEEISQNQ